MNIAIFSKSLAEENLTFVQQIVIELEHKNARLLFHEPFYKKIKDKIVISKDVAIFRSHKDISGKVDYLFSIGGDGTILDTLNLVRNSGIPVLGINLGRMGFLSSISKDKIKLAINQLFEKRYRHDRRVLIRVKTNPDLFGTVNYGLNEVSVYRKDPHSMLKLQAYVNGEFVNSYWADGLIVATPTGSTAYSLSNGGPIILPGSQNFVITPIATHNLTVRPVVIPDSCQIRIKVVGRIREFFVSLDSRSVLADASLELEIEREDFHFSLIQLEDETFFTTIREKLLWGLDIRN